MLLKRRTGSTLSILSELHRHFEKLMPPNHGYRRTFNSFWVASRFKPLAVFVRYDNYTFNSFWVASGNISKLIVSLVLVHFQFFLSCISSTSRQGTTSRAWRLTFNSFWVASRTTNHSLWRGEESPFNSFWVASRSGAREDRAEGSWDNFQFFLSCIPAPVPPGPPSWALPFQFFLSCIGG